MYAKRIIGVIIFALGVALLVSASQPVNGPSECLSIAAHEPGSLWLLFAGIASTVCGGILTTSGSRRRRSRNASYIYGRGL